MSQRFFSFLKFWIFHFFYFLLLSNYFENIRCGVTNRIEIFISSQSVSTIYSPFLNSISSLEPNKLLHSTSVEKNCEPVAFVVLYLRLSSEVTDSSGRSYSIRTTNVIGAEYFYTKSVTQSYYRVRSTFFGKIFNFSLLKKLYE